MLCRYCADELHVGVVTTGDRARLSGRYRRRRPDLRPVSRSLDRCRHALAIAFCVTCRVERAAA